MKKIGIIPKIARINCTINGPDKRIIRSDVNDYLTEVFREVFHKFEFAGPDMSDYDFIVIATEGFDTFEDFVRTIITSNFDGVEVKISEYESGISFDE